MNSALYIINGLEHLTQAVLELIRLIRLIDY